MFSGQSFTKPKNKSFFGVLALAGLIIFGLQTSTVLGYILPLAALVMMIIAMHMESIWPTQARKENSLAFSLSWELMIGTIVLFLITTFQEGRFHALFEIFMTRP